MRELGALHGRAEQGGRREIRAPQIRQGELRAGEVCALEPSAREVGLGEIHPFEVRVSEIGVTEIRPTKVSFPQIRPAEIAFFQIDTEGAATLVECCPGRQGIGKAVLTIGFGACSIELIEPLGRLGESLEEGPS